MTDLAVRGGRLVLPEGERAADLLISDGRIAAIVAPGEGVASETLDARGLVVLPGVVDAHVHFNDPGREEWEGWEAGTRGAAAGGVTTVCDMPLNSIPPTTTVAAFDEKRELAERRAYVDFGLWGGLTDGAELAGLRARGVVGVKAFLCDSGVPEFPPVPVERLRAATGLIAVHAEDPRELRDRAATWAASRAPAAASDATARSSAAGGRDDAHVGARSRSSRGSSACTATTPLAARIRSTATGGNSGTPLSQRNAFTPTTPRARRPASSAPSVRPPQSPKST